VARVLIVGCGCRGRELAGSLIAAGHQVRGTTRDPTSLDALAAAGVEGVVADPDRLATLLGQLRGVSVLCWLFGSVSDNHEALHGPRLGSLLETLVDTPVRGLVYEAAGTGGRGAGPERGGALSHADRGGRGRSGRARALDGGDGRRGRARPDGLTHRRYG
jgi:hypothetical protein